MKPKKSFVAIPTKSIILSLLLFSMFLGMGVTCLHADGQAWVSNSLDLKISPTFTVGFQQEQRFNEVTIMDPYLSNIEARIAVKTGKRTQFALAFRREGQTKADSVLRENRLFLDFSWAVLKNKKTTVDLRLRSESRNFEANDGDDHWRFRLRLRLVTKMTVGGIRFDPFLAIEPFGDTKADAINRYRFYAGVTVPLGKNAGFVLSYIRQGTRDKESLDILGTGFKLSF